VVGSATPKRATPQSTANKLRKEKSPPYNKTTKQGGLKST